MAPSKRREDVCAARGGPVEGRFDLVLPYSYDALRDSAAPKLRFERSGNTPIPDRSLPLEWGPRRGLGRARAGFILALVRILPSAIRWKLTGDHQMRARIKHILGIPPPVTAASQIEPEILAPQEAPYENLSAEPVTVVVPVYNAFDLLGEVLERALSNMDMDMEGVLLLVEDCSSDARVRPFLRDFQERHADRIRLIENDTNLGFIGSVNRAFSEILSAGGEGPVILLNSDALVPKDWTSRLVAPLSRDAGVASVTPMSNDAEILSVPAICRRHALTPGQGDLIDREARRLTGAPAVDLPTGVGFCMAISRDWLRRVPQFDTTFGRGYGEEVDWCQNVRALGGRHLAIPSLFVEHRGGASFGSEAKLALVARNNAIVSHRYPKYDREVQEFITADPLLTSRLALALAWAGSLSGVPVRVYLAHFLGGGADHYLEDRIEADREAGRPSVVLRVGGTQRWQVELHALDGGISGSTDDIAVVRRLLEGLPRRRIVYSCGVGDVDPITLPEMLLALRTDARDAVEILFHDFFPLSPSYTLLDSDGVFRGPPGPDRKDPAHRARRPDGSEVSLAAWQTAWEKLARAAEEIRVFSRDSAAQVGAVWPHLEDRIRIVPHEMRRVPTPLRAPAGRPVIGVLGNINQQKGAGVVQALAHRLGGPTAAESGLVLLGNLDPAYALPDWVKVTGTYRIETLSGLVATHRITHWLIPSIWPETFSFTTHEALATGMPVFVFDLGAQAEAAARASNGHVLPLPKGEAAAADAVLAALRTLPALQHA